MFYDLTLPIALKDNLSAWTQADALPAACILAEQPLAMATHLKTSGFLYQGGQMINEIEIEKLVGTCQVIRIPDAAKKIELKHLIKQKIIPHSKIFLKSKVSSKWDKAGRPPTPVPMDMDAAVYLADRQLTMLGIDSWCLDSWDTNDRPVEQLLLAKKMLLVENVNMDEVGPGSYEISCLPMLIINTGIAPCRVILKKK